MADALGIDVGNVLSRAEAIKEARTRNQFLPKSLALQQQAAEQGIASNALALKTGERNYNDETALRSQRGIALGGLDDPSAGLATISPKAAADFHGYLDSLDEDGKKKVAENIDKFGKLIVYVKGAKDPNEAYVKAKGLLAPEAQAQMPATWDPDWGDATLAQATELKSLLDHNTGKDAPSGYRWMPNGALTYIPGGPADPATKSAAKGGGLDSAIANNIKSTVAMQFGGEFDPQTGEFSLLDKTQANRMIEVMAAAQDLVAEDPSLTPARAVQQAMQAGSGNALSDAGGDLPKPTTDAEYAALPSGSKFIDPGDGKTYTKP